MTPQANELVLFLDNVEPLYKLKVQVFHALAKKKERGIYRKDAGAAAFKTLLAMSAKRFLREFGERGEKWNHLFTPIDRRHAALQLVEQFEDWFAVDYQALKD